MKLSSINYTCLGIGLIAVALISESFWAVFWAFIASVHISDKTRGTDVTIQELWRKSKQQAVAKRATANERTNGHANGSPSNHE